jgi:hypothetical protein
MPASGAIARDSSVVVSGRVTSGVDNGVSFALASGGGSLFQRSLSSAMYSPGSGDAQVTIRATSNANSAMSRLITFSVVATPGFFVVPEAPSSGLRLAPGSRQTFTAARVTSLPTTPYAAFSGVSGVQWFVWPSGTIDSTGTLTAATTNERLYALETSTNVWMNSDDLQVGPTTMPSVAITPAVSTVARNGVVQLTATTSTGGAVTWALVQTGTGSVSQTGTYTAPATAGIYLVQASTLSSGGTQLAYATIVVQ